MLDRDRIIAASKTLSDHWRAGTKLAGLDASCRPRDRAEGYAIQAEIEQISSGKLFGWKIAATSEAGQKHINVEGPMAGRILSETVIADGGTASMAGNEMRVAEPEFAFRMKADLPPRASPYSVQEVLDAVGGFRPRWCCPNHRRQCLRAPVRPRSARDIRLARARPGRAKARYHDARPAIHRSRQERAR